MFRHTVVPMLFPSATLITLAPFSYPAICARRRDSAGSESRYARATSVVASAAATGSRKSKRSCSRTYFPSSVRLMFTGYTNCHDFILEWTNNTIPHVLSATPRYRWTCSATILYIHFPTSSSNPPWNAFGSKSLELLSSAFPRSGLSTVGSCWGAGSSSF